MRPIAIRAHPLVFGVVVFLASESMLFAALLAAYYDLRGMNTVWPPPGVSLDTAGASFGTALLALGSITMGIAQVQAARSNFRIARAMVVLTLFCALGFTYVELSEWHAATFTIHSHAYGTMFYVLTGTHLAHVLAGAVLLIALSLFLRRRAFSADHQAGIEGVAYYWHFVFVIWLAVWATIYFVR